MKRNLIIALMLTCTFNGGFSQDSGMSTLAQRSDLIKALEKDPKKGLEDINKNQQDNDIKVDETHYIVVLEKEGDVYKRVGHFKKDKLNQVIEPSLSNVVQEAETKLAGGNGPIAFNFQASDKKMYCVLSKQGNFLIFNICPTQEEVDAFLKPAVKVEDKKPVEEPKKVDVAPAVVEQKKAEAPAVAVVEPNKIDDKKADVVETKADENLEKAIVQNKDQESTEKNVNAAEDKVTEAA
jgi:hypothetical protein